MVELELAMNQLKLINDRLVLTDKRQTLSYFDYLCDMPYITSEIQWNSDSVSVK
jgi:hypothetical protein